MNNTPIFTVGLYKCGTSWLSHILNKLPNFRTVKEVDFIKNSYDYTEERGLIELDKLNILSNYFGKNSWCKAGGIKHDELLDVMGDPDAFMQLLTNKSPKQKKFGRKIKEELFQEFFEFEPERAKQFIIDFLKAENGEQVSKLFIKANLEFDAGKRKLFKAADQIVVFEKLYEYFPDAPKIFVIRDGRDASISAFKFKKLMKEQGVPWLKDEDISYFELLDVWNQRVKLAHKYWQEGKIYLMKYEELKSNFKVEMAKLLEFLKIDFDENILQFMYDSTTFEKMSGGRKLGSEAKALVRKGQVGEWKEFLSEEEQELAIDIAYDGLNNFGYI